MYVNALRRGWWIVAAVVLATLAVVLLLSSRVERTYRSSTMVVVAPAEGIAETEDLLRSIETLERRTLIATFARVATTNESRSEAAVAAGIPENVAEKFKAEASVLPSTNIIRIDVEGPDGKVAAAIANALAMVTNRYATASYRLYTVRPLTRARGSSHAVRPDVRRNIVVAVTVGLILGLVAAFAVEHLRRLRTGS